MRKTKIVCTLGPATDSIEIIKSMIVAGMNVARLNFSHGSHEEHARKIAMVKQARQEMGVPVGILLDTKGPEIRMRTFKGGQTVVEKGKTFTLVCGGDFEGDCERAAISYPKLNRHVRPGDAILVNDGLIELKVTKVDKNDIICEVIEGGVISNRKSLNIPGAHIEMPYLSETDRSDILFGIAQDIEYVAASFVRSENDVKIIRNLLDANGGEEVDIIAKIENREGVTNIDSIIAASNGIMVARGDMGVEIPFEELPFIQKDIIKKCYQAGKKVITATQMLESMITNPRPTRAEISDVANAVYDGTSATMLSGETAAGKYPIETIKTMAKIIEKTEGQINYRKRFANTPVNIATVTDAISHSTCSAAHDLDCKAIIAVTQTGTTARKISRFRTDVPVIAATATDKAFNKLAINWGVVSVKAEMQPNTDELFAHAIECAKKTGIVRRGDLVAITAGVPVGIAGNSNILKIEQV